MVAGSEQVNPNTKYVVSAIAQNTKEPVNIKLTLRDKDGLVPVSSHDIALSASQSQQVEFDIQKWDKLNLYLDVNATFAGKNYSNTINLLHNNKFVSTFIQTDKALYKPGEKVNVRVVLTDQHLIPVPDNSKLDVFITDPKRNRVKQWLNATLTDGVFTGSYQLNEEQTLGDYQIHVETGQTQKKSKTFEVNEYVLPQFEVKLIAPKYLTYEDGKFTATVDAKYTHGKPINGLLKLTMKQRYFYPRQEQRFWPETRSLEKVEIEKPINGVVDVELSPVQQLSLSSARDYDLDLELEAVVTETLTKKNFTATSYLTIVEDNVKMEVVDSNLELKPGLGVEIAIKVVDKNDDPIDDAQNKVQLGYSFSIKNNNSEKFIVQEYTIRKGLIDDLKLEVPLNATDLFIRAMYKGRKYSIHHYQTTVSKSGRFIQLNVLNKQTGFKTGQKVDFELRSTHPIAGYTLMILKQNNIVSTTNYALKSESTSEKFSIDLEHKLAPSFKVAVFYLTNDNEIISDQKTVDVDDLFQTPIDLQSSTNQTQPGEMVDITVKTSPNAFVGVLGVDQSVLLLKSGNDITKKDVLNDLKEYGSGGSHYFGYNRRSMNPFFGSSDVFSSNRLFCIMNGFDVNSNRYEHYGLRMRKLSNLNKAKTSKSQVYQSNLVIRTRISVFL